MQSSSVNIHKSTTFIRPVGHMLCLSIFVWTPTPVTSTKVAKSLVQSGC